MRVLALVLILICFAHFSCYKFADVFIFISNWPCFTSMGHLLLTMKLSQDKHAEKQHFQLIFAHFLFTFTLVASLIVVPIYWSVIHDKALRHFEGNTCRTNNLYFVHIFPLISLLLNWFVTDIRLYKEQWKTFIPVWVIYSTINCIATVQRGVPLYWFLDWKDLKSPLICLTVMIVFSAVFYFIAIMSHHCKPF